MSQQVGSAAVDGLLRDNVLTLGGQRLDGISNSGGTGGHSQSGHTALQSGDALLEHILRGVGQAAVDVAGVGQAEAGGGVLRVMEHIGSGLVDRNRTGIGSGIGLLLTDVKLQGLKLVVAHINKPLSVK